MNKKTVRSRWSPRRHPWLFILAVLVLIPGFLVGLWVWNIQGRQEIIQPEPSSFPFFAADKSGCPVIYAHRGNTGRFPENSLESLVDASEVGSHVLETDLRLTRDRVLVLFHDSTLQRMTGRQGRVEDHTFAELQEMRVRQGGVEAVIPSFESVVEALGNARFNVEIKEKDQAVMVALWNLINTHGLHDRIQVSSFHHEMLVGFRQISGNRIPTGASPREAVEFLLLWYLGYEVPTAFVSLQLPYGGSPWLDTLVGAILKSDSGPKIQVFTVNSADTIEPLFGGASFGVMTDDPEVFMPEMRAGCSE